jgi:hypothetical protein
VGRGGPRTRGGGGAEARATHSSGVCGCVVVWLVVGGGHGTTKNVETCRLVYVDVETCRLVYVAKISELEVSDYSFEMKWDTTKKQVFGFPSENNPDGPEKERGGRLCRG